MVLQGLQGGALHRGEGVVVCLKILDHEGFMIHVANKFYLATSMSLEVGVVGGTEKLGQKHDLKMSESNLKISNLV